MTWQFISFQRWTVSPHLEYLQMRQCCPVLHPQCVSHLFGVQLHLNNSPSLSLWSAAVLHRRALRIDQGWWDEACGLLLDAMNLGTPSTGAWVSASLRRSMHGSWCCSKQLSSQTCLSFNFLFVLPGNLLHCGLVTLYLLFPSLVTLYLLFPSHQTHRGMCFWVIFLCWHFGIVAKIHALSNFVAFNFSI